MKRLVWLLLAVFCTALAQVQPVSLPVSPDESCSCCDVPGACGMPDCAVPPLSAPVSFVAEQPTRTAQAVARRAARQPRRVADPTLVSSAAAQAAQAALRSPVGVNAATPVPLFKAHCRFLI